MRCTRPISTTALILTIAALADAQSPPFIFLPTDRTINNSVGSATLIVGFDSRVPGTLNTFRNPSSPTISFIEPGGTTSTMFVYHASTVLADHATFIDVNMRDTSTLNIKNDTRARIVTLSQQSRFISSNSVVETLLAANSANITMNNAQISYPDGSPGNSLAGTVNLSGSADALVTDSRIFGKASASGESTLNLTRTSITQGVTAYGDGVGGTITLVDCFIGDKSVAGQVTAANKADIHVIESVIFGNTSAADDSSVSATASQIHGDVTATDLSTISISSGSVVGNVTSNANGTLLISDDATIEGEVTAQDISTVLMDNSTAASVSASGRGATIGCTNCYIHGSALTFDAGELFLTNSNVKSLTARNESQVTIDSSRVRETVYTWGNSKIFISNGANLDSDVHALDTSTILIESGNIRNHLIGNSESKIQMLQGSAFDVHITSTSTFVMNGGFISEDLQTSLSGTVNLFHGTVGRDIAIDGGTVNMFGGNVLGTLRSTGNGILNRFGGKFGTAPANPGGSGGEQFSLFSDAPIAVARAATTINSGIIGYDNSTINFFGRDLEATLIDPNFEGMFSQYVMSGKLVDGTVIDGQFLFIQNETGAAFHLFLVPEPCGIISASLMALGLLFRRPTQRRGQ